MSDRFPRRVSITINLEVTTDRDPQDYGHSLAKFLEGEIQHAYNLHKDLSVDPEPSARVTDTALVHERRR
jgi:hypothetical protein